MNVWKSSLVGKPGLVGHWLVLAVMALFATAVQAAAVLEVEYKFDGNLLDTSGNNYHGTMAAGEPAFVDGVFGQALQFSGEALNTGLTATELNIAGAAPKSVTAWVKTHEFNNGGIFTIGPNSGGQQFSLRTLNTDNRWRAQFIGGSYDFDFTAPTTHNNWAHMALVYDGSTARAYVNGQQVGSRTVALNTHATNNPLQLGVWDGNKYFNGIVDQFRLYSGTALSAAEIGAEWRTEWRAMGGYVDDFEEYGSQIDTGQWYTSGGMNSTRLRSNRQGGTYVLSTFDNDANDPPGHVRNVYNVHQDDVTSLTWGAPLRVLDDSHSLNFNMAGGSFDINEGSQRSGGAGLALWDLAANDFVREANDGVRFVTRSGNSGGLESQSMSLEGLTGRIVMPVLYDRQIGAWGWTEIDAITALPGAVAPVRGVEHKVLLAYDFDEPDDFMGWSGDTDSFSIGDSGGGLLDRHINLSGEFTRGAGFLSSALPGNWDTPTGTLRSPEFTLDGDIIEFYISGGSSEELSFELWADLDGDGNFTLERTARQQHNASAQFDYDFWTIRDMGGSQAYFQLVDGTTGSWGHIQVDAVRMVAFAVPEPSTFVLAAFAMLLLCGARRRRISR